MNPEILRDCALEISVWDYERNTGSYFLGGVRMNLGSGFYQGKPCDWMAEGWKTDLYLKKILVVNNEFTMI